MADPGQDVREGWAALSFATSVQLSAAEGAELEVGRSIFAAGSGA